VVAVADGGAHLEAVWFNQPYLRPQFRAGDAVLLHGKAKAYRGLQMVAPEYEVLDPSVCAEEAEAEACGLVPVHPATASIRPRLIRRLVREALERCAPDLLVDPLPERLRARRDLLPLADAARAVHFPASESEARRARERLAYDELLAMQLALRGRRRSRLRSQKAHRIACTPELDARARARFPFAFTGDQERAVREIRADLESPAPMNRLLHGEVGSGKTAVAAYAVLMAIGNGHQAALLAPTEVLAEQHARTIDSWLQGSKVRRVHLPGGLAERERSRRLDAIAAGEAHVVIGTHALLEVPVAFSRLALVVIDEQHKFGVAQRARLRAKGRVPDFLVMTATPIPRTLALTLFGDLEVSTLRELPPGRLPVRTRIVESRREAIVHAAVREEVARGRQAYFVYPLIDESETLDLRCAIAGYERLRDSVFPELRVGLVHGRLTSAEKEKAMADFRRGRTQILVATAVIEVGVDVPNATVMVVEEAGRFGLAQLHQLRGRIGRGSEEGTCFLSPGRAGDLGRRRLRILRDNDDGFAIARHDLEIRGPGEFFGLRQHGEAPLRLADPFTQSQLLEAAREDADEILAGDPDLSDREHAGLRLCLARDPGERADLARVG
jgi:ATP-dependent DNA helicase RecG